ncbi:ras-related protein Rab-30-like protein 1 [Dinothrombium tinctorium]|uniref:Ras-related protein Rab-30-like protein 1 n=1 Tax=Dinothrombium tinctorium TaxID=1965070 RepID=A0A3S3NM75_9ACAR|nr:ras-related protein Rab-30-like protein 1 [Dinothrombium tinctorium]
MASVLVPEFKVILVGEYGVGKTSLFRRFSTNTFLDTDSMTPSASRRSTLGLDHCARKFETKSLKAIKIQLWDTGGLERVASITNSYYKFAAAAILMFSLASIDSFHCLPQHLLEILSLAENAKIILVGNKCDLQPHEVTDSDIDMFLEQFPKFDGVYKISCKTNEGVSELFDEIAEQLASISYKSSFDAFKLHSHSEAGCCNANHLQQDEENYCCAK